MAKIIYGVMGDAGGHLHRALAVAKELPEHEFLFVGGGRIAEVSGLGYQYKPLPMLSTALKDNNVLVVKTAINFGKNFIKFRSVIDDLLKTIDIFKPDLALTDYEFFLPRAALKAGIPCISLDHQHVITHCSYDIPPGEQRSRFVTSKLIHHFFSAADSYLVSSFYSLPPKKSVTEVIPPIIGRDVLRYPPTVGSHVVVYMRTGVTDSLLKGLLNTKREYHVYGVGQRESLKNVHFLNSPRGEFLQDLASCSHVICNAGHTLTSEALHLGKPVLAFPASFFYEQYFNAYFLNKLNYGRFAPGVRESFSVINRFEKELEKIRTGINKLNFFGNEIAAQKINFFLSGCTR